MVGKAPIRRTLKYLENHSLILKERVKIFSVNYNTHGENHEGAKEFVFWHLPQLHYKNPNVQIVTFKNMTPSPFIRCYLGILHWLFLCLQHLMQNLCFRKRRGYLDGR